MTTPDKDLIGSLKRLFEACKNGENGHRLAAKQARRADLKALFQECAEQRGGYAAVWQGHLARLGAHDQKDSGTLAEALQQSWTELASAATGGGDDNWLAECGRADEAARKEFEEVLSRDLPADVGETARRQLAGIKDAQDRMRGLAGK